VRLPAGRAPAPLLQRRRRGRADHDDRADPRSALPRPDRPSSSGARRIAAAGPPGGARRGRRDRPAADAGSTGAAGGGAGPVSGPLILAVESSCDETGIALVEGG